MPKITEVASIQALLETDREWAAYALGDLDAALFPKCSWYAAGDGIALLFKGFDAPLLFVHGTGVGLSQVIEEVSGEEKMYLSIKGEALEILKEKFEVHEQESMVRMTLERKEKSHTGSASSSSPSSSASSLSSLSSSASTSYSWLTSSATSGGYAPPTVLQREEKYYAEFVSEVRALREKDIQSIRNLYADGASTNEAPQFFAEYMVTEGVFHGIFDGAELIAAAGTHLIAKEQNVAAIGCVYTRRDKRGQGLSKRVTGTVVNELLNRDIGTIVLNVKQSNTAAIRVYEKLGFRSHCTFFEGTALRK